MITLEKVLPFTRWFRGYNSQALRADLISGITVALVLIPQSMAYAQLAGLPAYYGLYAAFLPPMVASLFGSSNQLATGPVAVVSLMTAAALEPLATAGSPQFIQYAILLALLVGAFQFFLGVARLGLVINFLSHPVVNGFTNAAAIIIATSQLSKIFGVYVDKAPHHYQTIWRVVLAAFHYTHLPTLGMAALAFTIIYGLRRIDRRIPNVLVAVVVTTLLAWAVGFEDNRQVKLADIEPARVRGQIQQYNQLLAQRTHIEKTRRELGRQVQDLLDHSVAVESVCSSCHSHRNLQPQATGPAIRSSEADVLLLHHSSGLLDLRLQELKQEIGRLRAELRGLLFQATRGADERLTFLPADLRRWKGVEALTESFPSLETFFAEYSQARLVTILDSVAGAIAMAQALREHAAGLAQLLVEDPVKVGILVDGPDRQLGRQPHLLAVAILQRLAHQHLALAAMVGISGIQIVHAVIDGPAQHAHSLRLVNLVVGAEGRQAHTAESQRRDLPIQLTKLAVLQRCRRVGGRPDRRGPRAGNPPDSADSPFFPGDGPFALP